MFRVVSDGAQRSPVKKKTLCSCICKQLKFMRPFVPYLYSASDCIPLFRCRERREENINEPRRNECKIRDLDKRTSEGTNVRSENSGRVYGNIIPLSSSSTSRLASHVILQFNGGVRLLRETYPASALALDPQRRLGI